MLHIFALIIALTGQPVTVLEGPTEYQDEDACKADIPKYMVALQTALDTSDNPSIRGQYAVAEAICSTEEKMKSPAAPKPGTI